MPGGACRFIKRDVERYAQWRVAKHQMEQQARTNDEDSFPRLDGSVDRVRWEIEPWYERPGRVGGIILFSEAITGRKQIEDKLRRSEERYRRIVQTAQEGVWEVDGDK